ncbi:MAG: hypothetical protein Q4B50_02380 [Bacillota bacterium]|nr:hypothetical protein [Bacillota bacterium]
MNELFFEALAIMGKGMLGIFIVTCVIILCMVLLNKWPEKKKEGE